jgi:parvulin-like peptidyl-prolyl isomerase
MTLIIQTNSQWWFKKTCRLIKPHICCILLTLLDGCSLGSSKTRTPQTVAKVNDQFITSSEFVTELLKAGSSQLTSKTDRIKMGHVILDRLIEEKLILQAAKRANIMIEENELKHAWQKNAQFYPPAVLRKSLHEKFLTLDNYQAQLKQTMIIEKYLQQELGKLPGPSKALIKIKMEEEKFIKLPKRVHARQILLQNENEARFVLAKISQEKMSFATAARQYSIAPEAEIGGDLGWFEQRQLPPIFDYCFALKKMQVSDAIVSPYGYHIFQVINKQASRTESTSEFKKRVQENIEHEHEQNGKKQIIDLLRKKARIWLREKDFTQIINSMSEK